MYLEKVSSTPYSLTIRIAGLDLTYWQNWGTSNLPRHVSANISGTVIGQGGVGATTAVTFSGLSPGTEYGFSGTVSYLTGSNTPGDSTVWGTFTTDSIAPSISYFSWSVAQSEPISSGSPAVIRATSWNALIGKIEQVKGSHVPHLKVSTGNTLTASLYNSTVAELKSLNYSAPVSNVSVGSTVTAARINALQTAINYIIDNL